ncbi:MAG TPA: hypothetical protein VN789_04360 [Casimicrobiaceae bacterium]|jgi:hypothetical protein|nr:hypothetical protein [Casimicrobiaceae bacterium]
MSAERGAAFANGADRLRARVAARSGLDIRERGQEPFMEATNASRIEEFPQVEVHTAQEADTWAHRLQCSRAELLASLAEVGSDFERLAATIARRRQAPPQTRTVLGFSRGDRAPR